jgi:hypothetical protein
MHNYSISKMQTRSQSKALLNQFEFVFDFDAASEAWKSNKKSIGNGTYMYVCQKRTLTGKPCSKKCLAGENFCKTHYKK